MRAKVGITANVEDVRIAWLDFTAKRRATFHQQVHQIRISGLSPFYSLEGIVNGIDALHGSFEKHKVRLEKPIACIACFTREAQHLLV